MSTITRRRVGGQNNSDDEHASNSEPVQQTNAPKVAYDPRDIDESKSTPKLTLMEEVLLLGLKDKQVTSFIFRDCRRAHVYNRVTFHFGTIVSVMLYVVVLL